MALNIKKTIYDEQGRVSEELDGTEAEIEAYEKKKKKKNESTQKKKEILHGKAAKALKNQDVMGELKKFIAAEIAKANAVREIHHWYFSNGWWWYPRWDNGIVTYYYSKTAPGTLTNDFTSVLMSNNADEFMKTTGVSPGIQLTSTNANGISTNSLQIDTKGIVFGQGNAGNGWSSVYTVSDMTSASTKTDGSVN